MRLLLMVLLMHGCRSNPRDLSGHLMEFLEGGPHVDIQLPRNVDSATVCLRFFTDMRHHDCLLLSMATPALPEAFRLTRTQAGRYEVFYNTSSYPVRFSNLPERPSAWNSICATWDSAEGLEQLWLNEARSAIKRCNKGPGSLSGSSPQPPKVTLGRVRLSYDMDKFGVTTYFMGEMKDVHMWDYVLDACEIKKYMADKKAAEPFTPGNVINWKSLEYTASNNVTIKKDEYDCPQPLCV